MSVSYVKIFNQIIHEFFNELIDIFPEEPKMKVQYTLFQTIIKANAKKPAIEFMTKSLPYLEKIAMRDEQFFLSPDTPDFLQALNVQKIWATVSDNTREMIWKYIQSFFTIGIKIVEMPQETHEIINYILNKS